jgi:hypothetical protein
MDYINVVPILRGCYQMNSQKSQLIVSALYFSLRLPLAKCKIAHQKVAEFCQLIHSFVTWHVRHISSWEFE